MLYSIIWGCTVRPLQSDEMNWACWVAPSKPLVIMTWALRGIIVGAIRNIKIVEDEEEENSSVSSHIMLEQKAGTGSNTMVIGKRNLNLCMVSMALSVNCPSPYSIGWEWCGFKHCMFTSRALY